MPYEPFLLGMGVVFHLLKKLRNFQRKENCQKNIVQKFCLANPPASYRSLLAPLGPSGPKKSDGFAKRSRKSPRLSRLFPDFWGPREGFFETFLGFRARRARKTRVARGKVRKFVSHFFKIRPFKRKKDKAVRAHEICQNNQKQARITRFCFSIDFLV